MASHTSDEQRRHAPQAAPQRSCTNSKSALGAWVGVCGVRLQPIVDALHAEMMRQAVLHADETPVQMLSPGKGKTHRAYLWAYTAMQFSSLRAVVYDFASSRAGEHARAFLGTWQGKLVCDDYSGYKAGFNQGMTRNRVHGACTPEVLRPACSQQKPDCRAGAEILRRAVRHRA